MEAHIDIGGTIPFEYSMTLIGTCRRLDHWYWFSVWFSKIPMQKKGTHRWRIDFDFDPDSGDLHSTINRCGHAVFNLVYIALSR